MHNALIKLYNPEHGVRSRAFYPPWLGVPITARVSHVGASLRGRSPKHFEILCVLVYTETFWPFPRVSHTTNNGPVSAALFQCQKHQTEINPQAHAYTWTLRCAVAHTTAYCSAAEPLTHPPSTQRTQCEPTYPTHLLSTTCAALPSSPQLHLLGHRCRCSDAGILHSVSQLRLHPSESPPKPCYAVCFAQSGVSPRIGQVQQHGQGKHAVTLSGPWRAFQARALKPVPCTAFTTCKSMHYPQTQTLNPERQTTSQGV